MKRKGFTLVELLVVIAIIALLMGILMPALARVRQIAHRMVCGSNLRGIGTAFMVYANDYDQELPDPPSSGKASWGSLSDPYEEEEKRAFARGNRAACTMTCVLFHLVKYADVTTKTFVCKGDAGTEIYEESEDWQNMVNSGIDEIKQPCQPMVF